jgi:dienelactone hydrolase
MKQIICCLAAVVLMCCAGFGAQNAPAARAGSPQSTPVSQAADVPPILPANTPLGTGPFKAIMEMDPGLQKHTVYRPADMMAIGSTKLPIIAWGNGACGDNGNAFRPFLTEIASHGYLAIANGTIGPDTAQLPPGTAGNAPNRGAAAPAGGRADAPATGAGEPRPAGATMTARTTTAQLIEAIDWAIAENSRLGSIYYGKLDTSKVAVAGQSCGGVQAIEASADPRIKTTIIGNSGLLPTPTTMTGSGKPVSKQSLNLMHAPALYMSGDEQDVAYPNANDDFERINHIPVFRTYAKGIGHIGTYRNTDGGIFAKVALAWLNWQLKGDQAAAKMFVGVDCGLCADSKWVIRKKNMD